MSNPESVRSIHSSYSQKELRDMNSYDLPGISVIESINSCGPQIPVFKAFVETNTPSQGKWIENPPPQGLEGVVTATSKWDILRRQMARKNK